MCFAAWTLPNKFIQKVFQGATECCELDDDRKIQEIVEEKLLNFF